MSICFVSLHLFVITMNVLGDHIYASRIDNDKFQERFHKKETVWRSLELMSNSRNNLGDIMW